MAVLLDQFVRTLADSGLMAAEEVEELLRQVPEDERPKDGRQLATLLCRRKRLTPFQAQAVYRGKAKGLILNDYVVLDKIGQGGMGAVYKAEHRRMKRTVALKVLSAELTESESAVERFQQEVEAAARLIHPNVATAFDAGAAGKTHFLVMEFVDGETLEAIVAERGPLPVAEAVDYVLQAATGLAYAHEQGVIHRDIKPSNLMRDRKGVIKILDLGLARMSRQIGGDEATLERGLTRSGDVMGTIDYMSPEQAASTKHVDHRADIYSLGCTLYYLLHGRPMYEGATMVERVLAHREHPLPDLRAGRDDVPVALSAGFRQMVAKKPDSRFRTMRDVIAQLERCRGGESGRRSSARARRESASAVAPTVPFGESPTKGPAGAPPPPEIAPRDRRRDATLEKTQRLKKTLADVKEQQAQKERKRLWSDTIDDAVRQQRRQARWLIIRRWLSGGFAVAVRWLTLLVLIAMVAYGSYFVWRNNQRMEASRERVLTAVNQLLLQSPYEPVIAIEFGELPVWQSVPEELAFEQPLQPRPTASIPSATLQGRFYRPTGIIRINKPFRVQVRVEPVE